METLGIARLTGVVVDPQRAVAASAPREEAKTILREVTDVSSTGSYGTPADTSSGAMLSLGPDATDAFLVGRVLLTIAGATFAARRTRPVSPA